MKKILLVIIVILFFVIAVYAECSITGGACSIYDVGYKVKKSDTSFNTEVLNIQNQVPMLTERKFLNSVVCTLKSCIIDSIEQKVDNKKDEK